METSEQHSPETNINNHIPIEILMEILVRLPAKSLVRLILVCNSWHSLITSPSFIITHMNRNSFPSSILVRPKKTLAYKNRPSKQFCSVISDNTFVEHGKYRFPFQCIEENELVSIGNSCHGLFCLAFGTRRILGTKLFLYNPATQRYQITFSFGLPQGVYSGRAEVFFSIGLGFCQSTDQHKIVRIGYITYNKSTMLEKVPYEVEVYGLSTGSWRSIQANVPCVADYVHHRPVTCNGSIHWLATRRDDEVCDAIMAFDISNEVFSVLELPDECSHSSLMDAVLLVFEGLISLFMRNPNEREQEEMKCYDIWVMREYNVTKSCTKQYTIETNSLIKKVLGFTQGGKLILRMDNNMLASWDPKDQQFEDLGINGELYHVDTGFTESLILLDNRKTVVPWKVM